MSGPNKEKAAEEKAAKKRKAAAGKRLIKEYLEANIDKDIHTDVLKQVTQNDSEYARRIRDLRAEGMVIHTRKDSPDIPVHHYRFTGIYMTPRVKVCSERKRREILERDGSRCQVCGARALDIDENGKIVRVQVGHRHDQEAGGDNSDENLEVQCTRCNTGGTNAAIHKAEDEKTSNIMNLIRRTNVYVKKEVFEKVMPFVPPSEIIEIVSKKLALTPDRRARIAAILEEHRAENHEIYVAAKAGKHIVK